MTGKHPNNEQRQSLGGGGERDRERELIEAARRQAQRASFHEHQGTGDTAPGPRWQGAQSVRDGPYRDDESQAGVVRWERPGGMVSELKMILKTLDRYRDIRTVAYVEETKSAAAILALACREIVMADRAQIGAATPYVLTPEGTPRTIDAKLESAVRADFRSAAQYGGHNALLVEGMMRDDIVLGLKGSSKGAQIVEGVGDKVLKPQGQILTLTTQEAIECGLAAGSAQRIADCRGLLGIEQWCQRAGKTSQDWAGENQPLEEIAVRGDSLCSQWLAAGGCAWRTGSRWPRFTPFRRYERRAGRRGGLRERWT